LSATTASGFCPKGAPADQTITGHIDFLQVRNGAVHILDYKPDARTNRPFAQLTIYALALTRLAGLRLFDIKWGGSTRTNTANFSHERCSPIRNESMRLIPARM
jgi:ATP-dependent exoDNAse (exonuclease V) beta subunit